VVLAILGMYTGLTLVAKGLSGGKKDAAPAVAAASTGAFPPTGYKSGTEPGTAGVPSFTDANFEVRGASGSFCGLQVCVRRGRKQAEVSGA